MNIPWNDAGADDPTRILTWIATQWDTFAAIAWRGYLTSGRGLVVLAPTGDGTLSVGYAAAAEPANRSWPASLRAVTTAYTPATDILILVQQDTLSSLFQLRATPRQRPPCLTGQLDGAPLYVSAA